MKYELTPDQEEAFDNDDTSKTSIEFRERFVTELLRDHFNNNEKITDEGKGKFAKIVAKTSEELKTLLSLPERVKIDFDYMSNENRSAEVDFETQTFRFNTNSIQVNKILEKLSEGSSLVSEKLQEYVLMQVMAHEFHHVRQLTFYPKAVKGEIDRNVPYLKRKQEYAANLFAYKYLEAKANRETDPGVQSTITKLLAVYKNELDKMGGNSDATETIKS